MDFFLLCGGEADGGKDSLSAAALALCVDPAALLAARMAVHISGSYNAGIAVYTFLQMFILAILAVVCRKEWKRFFPVLLGIGIAYGAYAGPFYSVLHVAPGGVEEMLSVPCSRWRGYINMTMTHWSSRSWSCSGRSFPERIWKVIGRRCLIL